MRRSTDKVVLACAALCVLCTIVTVFVVAPTVLDTSQLATENQDRIKETQALARKTAANAAKIDREGVKRRSQTCRIDERDHLASVKRLRRTYAYLLRLPREEYGTNLTEAILRQLPEIEREARQDVAPPFCDEPGVGLKEPDPKLPERRRFEYLMSRP